MDATRPDKLRRPRLVASLAVLACAAAGAIVVGPAGAQSVGELNSRIDSAEGEAQSLAADIDLKSAQLTAARSQALAAAEREQELSATLARGQAREAELQAQVDEAAARLAEARARLGRAVDALSARLVALYKGETPDPTALLLESNGFDDLTTRTLFLRRIEEADERLAERVRALRDAVAARHAEVSAARDEQAAVNAEISAARDEIAAARAAAEQEAAALEAARADQAAALDGLRSQVDQWTEEVQQAQQVSAAEAQEEVAGWVGQWAIPQAIVMCESGGNYNARNPSGAYGAYQIMPEHWNGGICNDLGRDRAGQDECASRLWNGGSGAGNWVCAG
jgi:septal ring factor EnvC (AmiA/AmiB activator)